MKIVRMYNWFFWIPKIYWTKDVKEVTWLIWRFIFKWTNSAQAKKSLSNCRFSLCYKAKRTVGFQPMAYNGSGLNEVCLAQPFKFTDTLHRHISFKPLLWDVFLKISGGKSLNN